MAANNSSILDAMNRSTTDDQTVGGYTEADLMKIGTFVAALRLIDVTRYVCLGIGIPSNIFSVLTSSSIRPVSSSTVFMTILAVIDLSYILWDGLFWLLIPTLKAWIPTEVCRLYFFLGSVLIQSSVWILVAISGERFVAVWMPLRVSNICTTKRAAAVSLIGILCIGILNIPYTFMTDSYLTPFGAWYCRYHPRYRDFLSKWTFVEHSVYILIPWPILAFFNMMIICGLRLSQKRKQRLTNQNDNPKNPNLSITIMLVSTSVVSLVLLTPNMIFFIHLRTSQWDYQSTAEDYATYMFWNTFIFFLSTMNHAINFWVYVVSGRRFRQRFLDILRCRCKSKPAKYSQPSTTGSKLSASRKIEDSVVKTQDPSVISNGKNEMN